MANWEKVAGWGLIGAAGLATFITYDGAFLGPSGFANFTNGSTKIADLPPLVPITALAGGGAYLVTRPSKPRSSGRSRTRGGSHTGGVTSHNRRSRYRGH
jgi:hypothetical protein